MSIVESTQEVPLQVASDGTIRIAGSRVSLDSIVYHYRNGATVEEIVQRFPGLPLADIHSSIAYVLNHGAAVDEYLADREQSAAVLREEIGTDAEHQQALTEMRARLMARQSERMKAS